MIWKKGAKKLTTEGERSEVEFPKVEEPPIIFHSKTETKLWTDTLIILGPRSDGVFLAADTAVREFQARMPEVEPEGWLGTLLLQKKTPYQ